MQATVTGRAGTDLDLDQAGAVVRAHAGGVLSNARRLAPMTLQFINPEDLPTPASYSQVVVATGSRLVFVAGQVADDAQGNLVVD